MIIPFLLILSISLFFSPGAEAQTEPTRAQESINGVVMLSSSEHSSCGSGFILKDGKVVTAAHVVRSECPYGNCNGLEILTAHHEGDEATELIPYSSISVETIIDSLDLAVLNVDTAASINSALTLSSVAPIEGMKLTSWSFPRCGPLKKSEGSISSVNAISFLTSAEGAHGSSGSPILNESGGVVGVVDAAPSLYSGLSGVLFGNSFQVHAARVDRLASILSKSYKDGIEAEAEFLIELYEQEILPVKGLRRILIGSEFYRRVLGLLRRARAAQNGVATLTLLNATDPLPMWNQEQSSDYQALTALSIITSLEQHGFRNERLVEIPLDDALSVVSRSGLRGELKNRVAGITQKLHSDGFLGSMLFSIGAIVLGFGILAILTTSLGFSLGRVYSLSNGGTLKRLLKAALIGLAAWPISWVIFEVMLSRRLKRMRKE